MKYQKKNATVKAHQWKKNGDYPGDQVYNYLDELENLQESEGKIVKKYYTKDLDDDFTVCNVCNQYMYSHGWLPYNFDGLLICPGDFIVTNPDNTYTIMRENEFLNEYESINEDYHAGYLEGKREVLESIQLISFWMSHDLSIIDNVNKLLTYILSD